VTASAGKRLRGRVIGAREDSPFAPREGTLECPIVLGKASALVIAAVSDRREPAPRRPGRLDVRSGI
jgi:hypothetical protein